MRVMGLVVGVDLQFDPEIEQLPFAGADAEWLQALLADLNEHDPRPTRETSCCSAPKRLRARAF